MGAKTAGRLVILLVVMLVASVSIFFIQRYQVSRMDRSVLARAERAAKDGDLEKARRLYAEHLEVSPTDDEAKLKLAELLLEGGANRDDQAAAANLYSQVLTRSPYRGDVRRRRAKLSFEMGQYEQALEDVENLLRDARNEGDGELLFMLARCREERQPSDVGPVAESYKAAIEKLPRGDARRVEAYQRRAALLQKLDRPQEADGVIREMAASDPDDYRVQLEEGLYYRRYGKGPEAEKIADRNFAAVLAKAPGDPEAYAKLAEMAVEKRDFEAARRALDAGLKVAPRSPALHLARALAEQRSGSADRTLDSVRKSLEQLPDEPRLHWLLASLHADAGRTTELLREIEELNRLAFAPPLVQYLQAAYHVNSRQWRDAQRILERLRSQFAEHPSRTIRGEMLASVNKLLAQCAPHLGDAAGRREQEALAEAVRANPQDASARLRLALLRLQQGQADQAVEDCRRLLGEGVAPARGLLIQALIARNAQLPPSQRNWDEAESLLRALEQSAPDAGETMMLRAELLQGRGRGDQARAALERARAKSPRDARLWVASVNLLVRQKRYAEARGLLDQAKKVLGDTLELRLARAGLLVDQEPADLARALEQLAEDAPAPSREDRGRLLRAIAAELTRRGERAPAARLWKELAALDPTSLAPWLNLLEFALEADDKPGIEHALEQVRRIDGGDGPNARYWAVRYTIWQAEQLARDARGGDAPGGDAAGGRDSRQVEALRLRNEARQKLAELAVARPDWPLVPLALARLDELDAAQPGLDEAARAAKLIDAAGRYRQAIELGQNNLLVLRHASDLLYEAKRLDAGRVHEDKRAEEMRRLWTPFPDLGRQASEVAFRNNDVERAVDLARAKVESRPEDFQARLWLVQLLIWTNRRDDAEKELAKAVERDPASPEPRLTLVELLTASRRLEEAEAAVEDARKALGSRSPLELARCYATLSQAYAAIDPGKAGGLYDQARRWFKSARDAGDASLAATRQSVEFLVRSNQLKDAADLLAPIAAGRHRLSGDPDALAWATRALAQIRAASGDPRGALELVGPIRRKYEQRGPDGPLPDPDDLRTLALVYEAQQTPEGRKQAREVREALLAGGSAGQEDRFALAALYSRDGDWTKARAQYKELIAQTDRSRDAAGRVRYLTQFLSEILKRQRPDQPQDLAEARELLEKLKAIVPDASGTVGLEAWLVKAEGRADRAAELLREAAGRPGVSDEAARALALQAETIGLPDLAEELLRRRAARSDDLANRTALALLVDRRGRFKEALDALEPLWKEGGLDEQLAPVALRAVELAGPKPDPAQLERVAGWAEAALKRRPDSQKLLVVLAGLRERQGRLPEAEGLLRRLATRFDDARARVSLVLVLGRQGRPKEALDALEPLWKRAERPETLVPYIQLILDSAGADLDRVQVDRVAGWLQGAVERKPDAADLLPVLGVLRERQGRFDGPDGAMSLYRRDIEQGGASSISLNNLAWLTVLRGGKGDEALRYINRAIERSGAQAELLDTRGMVELKSGDARRAIEDLKKACELDPKAPKYFHLAQAYLQANDRPAAERAMARAKGLRPEELHPLEAPAYRQVAAALGVK